jgi:16S rRNA (guanine1207-N2)-methyltransferase
MTDDTLRALLLPFAEGRLARAQGKVLFLRARFDAALMNLSDSALVCEQTFKPEASMLEQLGLTVASVTSGSFDLVLVLPPRQRDEARALFARAVGLTSTNGRIIACAANTEGARSHESDLAQLIGPLTTLSKHKCRVFWTEPLSQANVNTALVDQWKLLDTPRKILNDRFMSRPGVFAWDRIDPASTLLAAHLPKDLSGVAADLGVGYGYLSAELLTRCPRISQLDMFEAEHRALELATHNLGNFTQRVTIASHWHDVTQGLPRQYDVIVSNPPFHTPGGSTRPDIGRRFIAVAGDALKPNGRLWLVANRHLAYESVLDATRFNVRIVTQQHGFKIIEAIKLSAKSSAKLAAQSSLSSSELTSR